MASRGPRSPFERIGVGARLRDAAFSNRLKVEVQSAPDMVWNENDADVLIVDSAWPTGDETCLLVLADEMDASELPSAVRALLPLDATPATILSAVRLVAEGLNVLPDFAVQGLSEIAAGHLEDDHGAARPAILTPREDEVLRLLASGASNKMIARKLGVSVHTAKFHVASLLRKLGASGRLEAVGVGLRTGLLMI